MTNIKEPIQKKSAFTFLTELEKSGTISENQKVLLGLLAIGQQYEQSSRLTERQRKERKRKNREARLSRKLNR